MADSLTPSASTNPFNTQPEEQGVPRRNCPSPHNPFSLPARASSPGNPFAPPIASSTAPPDDVLPFSDVCEPMQPIKIDVMFPELATNDRPIATSNTTNDVAATYGESSDFPERYLSKTREDVPTNHVADGPSSRMSSWGNNTNNSNREDETVESGFGDCFGDGFGDDFGSLSHTDVIFKTGFMDNNFKAVGVTAEEDDLWSSSFIMDDPSPDGETLQSSGDQESTNQGEETCTRSEDHSGMQFNSHHTAGAVPEVDEQGLGLSKAKVHVEVDFLPDLTEGPWDPWSPEDTKEQLSFQDQSTSDPRASRGPTSEQSHWIENSQESGVEDMFSMQGSGRWGVDAKVDAGRGRGKEVDESGQDPWAPCKITKDATDHTDQKAANPQALDLSAPLCNPSSSEDSFRSSLQKALSPFQDEPSSPFHPQYDSSSFPFLGTSQLQGEAVSGRSDPWSPSLIPDNQEGNDSRGSSPFHSQNDPTSNSTDSSSFPYQGISQLQVEAFGTHNDPWSPSLTPDNQDAHGPRRSRSPNPFTPVEDTANPFLHDLDLLSGKLGKINQRQLPVIPKFEEDKAASPGSNQEGASTSAIMEGAAAEPEVYTNGTDTLDVAEHDDIFDVNGSAEITQTDDEFENNERMMEEEDAITKKEFAEVEDIFQNDNHVIDTNDIEKEKVSKAKEEVEDIFGDDLHVEEDEDEEEEEHDYEPIFTADAREEEPVIKITDVDAERSNPEVTLEPEGSLDNEADTSELDLPFPDMPRKSDISLNWEEVVEEEQKKKQPSAPTPPPIDIGAPSSLEAGQEEEIDEGEVAKFVEKILISSMNEVSSQAEEQESQSQIGNVVEVQVSEPAFEAPETTVESDNVLSLEMGSQKVDVDVADEPAEKEDYSVSIKAPASEHADINGLAKDHNGDDREVGIHTAVPVVAVEVAKEVEDVFKDSQATDHMDSPAATFKDTQGADFKYSPAVEVSATFDKTEEPRKTPDYNISVESKPEVDVAKSMESSEGRQRKMSVPRPRDVRKDLSQARPSFFGSNTSGPKPFMSNTLPRVSVLPKISTSYQRKSPTSPMSLSGDYSSFNKGAEELPTVAGPDLSKDDSPVINELGTIELPLIETLSKPSSPKAATASIAMVDPDYVVPTKESQVESGPMAPVYAHQGVGKDPIVLDGTTPEEIESMFAKDPEEEEPKKKSMGKDDVLASTRVRKVSRTTWKGQVEFQKSVDKSSVVLDQSQAASLKRYEERKKNRFDTFTGKYRAREDSTSEAESEGSQSSQSGPKMPDVVQSGGKVSSHAHPDSEIVAPKLNMKSVRSLWEQKAAEVEQRRRSLQTKSRPVSQGERARPSHSKGINKSVDGLDNLDDSIEGSTTYSYDGTSDDGSTKRESLIDRDIRLQKERTLEISKERDRLRSESTSSRDESQQSETSESQDDQLVDIVRDTELRRDSDDGRSSPSQSSGYTSGRSTPSTPAGDDILKVKTGKSLGKTPELKMSLSPTDPEASSINYKEYQKALKGSKADGKFSKSATFPRRMENYDKQAESSGVSPTNSVGDVPDVIMVDGNKATSPTGDKPRKASIVQQGIKLSQNLEKKKIVKLEKKPRRSLMELEIAAQREKEEAFRKEQKTRKMSTSKSVGDEAQPDSSSSASSTTSSPNTSPRKTSTSVSGTSAKQVYKDLNYAPHTNKKKLALAGHWEHKWK